jgi:hypothetical protein
VEIAATGVSAGLFTGASAENGLLRMVVARDQQRATITRIWNAGGEVVSVIPQRRSLEEVFLEVTNERQSEAPSGHP